MYQTVEVLAVIDNANKIYYTQEQNFAANDREAIKQATSAYFRLVLKARLNGYRIIKMEKSVSPSDEGIIAETDEDINKVGGKSR